MEKVLKIQLTKAIDFSNHKNQCRLCLNKFNNGKDKIKMTKTVENQFFELTQIDLDTSSSYSNFICAKCQQYLNEFTILKNDWIFRQFELRKFVDNGSVSLPIKLEPDITVKYDIQDDDCDVRDEDYQINNEDESSEENEYQEAPKAISWDDEFNNFEIPKRKHVKTTREFVCPYCSVSFHRHMTLENHFVYRHKEKLSKEEIDRIKKNDRLSRIRVCPECGIKTDHLKQHIRFVHQRISSFFCDCCDYSTYKKFNIRSHVLKHSNMEKRFICEKCGVRFTRKSGKNLHMREFHKQDDRTFPCHCGVVFQSASKLWRHRRLKHAEDAKLPCPHCDKMISKDALAEHIRVDPEDKLVTYTCNDCNMKFPNKRCLKYHQTLHQDRNFICDFQDCNRSFLSLTHLQSHQKWHTIVKHLKCPYEGCDKTYTKQQGLKIHVATKHEMYRKNCPVPNCTYQTGIFQDMRGHVKRHRELKPDIVDEFLLAVRKLNLY